MYHILKQIRWKLIFGSLVLPVLAGTIILYGTISFVEWNVNLIQWGWLSRLILLAGFVLFIIACEEDPDTGGSIFKKRDKSWAVKIEDKAEEVGNKVSDLFQEKLKTLRR